MASEPSEALDLTTSEKLLVVRWEHLNLWRFYPLALASSWSIRCFLYPMSVVKSRLQLQRQNNVYRNMRHAFSEILKTEGPGALYRGFWVTVPQLSASFLYSSTYERTRDLMQVQLGIRNPALVSALAGGIASPCAQLVFVPTDIVAQHMMVHNNPEAFGGSRRNVPVAAMVRTDGLEGRCTLGLRVIRAVYKVDGLSGFYRGFLSAVLLYIPSTMVFWSTYYHALGVFRRIRIQVTELQRGVRPKSAAEVDNRNLFLDQAISGSIGGIASACVTNPLEMLRIRLQVHRTSYADTIRRLWRYEGSKVFTKGLAPRVVSNAIYSSFVMLAYETVKKISVLPEYRDDVVWFVISLSSPPWVVLLMIIRAVFLPNLGDTIIFLAQMSARRALSRFDRVNQWLQFARQWHLVDADHQDAFQLGKYVAKYLAGKHKPIWHPETDCGDHVVVVNCRHVAMHGFDWKHTLFHFNKEYPKSKVDIPAWQIHEYDPCRIVFLAVYKGLGHNLIRRTHIQRLHLFPGTDMPDFVKENLGSQLEQIQPVAKRSDEYTPEERAKFPKLISFPPNHVEEWERIVPVPGRYEKKNPLAKK